MSYNPVDVLMRCMQDADQEARQALADNDMDAHMEAGLQYHIFADAIAKATGVDPRPTE